MFVVHYTKKKKQNLKLKLKEILPFPLFQEYVSYTILSICNIIHSYQLFFLWLSNIYSYYW